ncbi:DUF4115 domain-containing protein [Heyndrickxia oleronia]|uniref:helix-turn-helix domain-containing protein n=1 Tax=Heyndrickxia oleronia TaxID=38875 RepID=UPI000716F8DB|nr:RodZ domain-containing protein [Heyndrickxia oleronia]MBU5211185.1 DUF4115 domain-containing protein [Heyndrickxia oleronia]MCM3454111.1 DUF4115 domain-containing protein [Heyndrickxia oleronia]NYV66987.1 helix-turn-helix domain-containing protein [Bacillus sp. Gen3]
MTELGSRLKEARQAKGLSLDDLQEITKIQKRYLKGIEEGNYDMMPGKFYVRAFIKQYAEAVGLETEQIFEEYKREVPDVYNEDLPEQISRVQSRKTVAPSTSKMLDIFPKILVAVFIIAAIALVYYLVTNFAGSGSKDKLGNSKDTPIETQPVKEKNKPVAQDKEDKTKDNTTQDKNDNNQDDANKKDEEDKKAETPAQEVKVISASGRNSTYQLVNSEKFEVKLVSTGRTWVNMKNGQGHSFFQGTLEEGKSQAVDFSNETEAYLVIGNATQTEIYINDQKLEFAVPPSESTSQNITIQFEKTKTE